MKKKGILICGALLVLVLCFGGYYIWQQNQQGTQGSDEVDINLTIIDASTEDEYELYTGTVSTKQPTLSALLKEMKEDKIISLEYDDGQYGMYITGMGGAKSVNENPVENAYWLFTSDNNTECIAAEYCPVADQVFLHDGDTFVFRLEKMDLSN